MAADRDATLRKIVLIDSSSAIIIYKSGFIDSVLDFYSVVIHESVYTELTREGYTGSKAFRTYRHEKKICVNSQVAGNDIGKDTSERIAGLGPGERDTILLYLQGVGDFVIVDDGRAALFCKKRGIRYINALLVPRLLYNAGRIDSEEKNRLMQRIIEHGRYSSWVIEYARSCTDQELSSFGQ